MRLLALLFAISMTTCGATPEDNVRFGSFVCSGIDSRDAVRTASLEVYKPADNQTCADCYRGACRLLEQVCRCGNADTTSDVTLRSMFAGLKIEADDVTSVCVRVVGFSGAPANTDDCPCRSLGVFDAEMCSSHARPLAPGDGPLTLATECRLEGRQAFDTCRAPD